MQGETEDVHDLAVRLVDYAERFGVPQLRFDVITQNPARSFARLLTDSGIIPPLITVIFDMYVYYLLLCMNDLQK